MVQGRAWGCLFLGAALAVAQTGEEPIRKAELSDDSVPATDPHVEPVRKAEKHEKPRTDTGTAILPGHPVGVKIET